MCELQIGGPREICFVGTLSPRATMERRWLRNDCPRRGSAGHRMHSWRKTIWELMMRWTVGSKRVQIPFTMALPMERDDSEVPSNPNQAMMPQFHDSMNTRHPKLRQPWLPVLVLPGWKSQRA